MMGSSCGWSEMTGATVSPSDFSGPPYCQLAAGPTLELVGQSLRQCPGCSHPQYISSSAGGGLFSCGLDCARLIGFSCGPLHPPWWVGPSRRIGRPLPGLG